MSRFVVDTSVVVKWFMTEVHSEDARRLLIGDCELLVPDLLFPEFGNALWKRVRSRETTHDEAIAVLDVLLHMPLTVYPSSDLAIPALDIANRTLRTVYDATYLALAIREKALLVTADSRFVNALQNTPLAMHLLWVESIAHARTMS